MFFLVGIGDNMSFLLHTVKHGVITTPYPKSMVYCVVKYMSDAFTLQ